MQSQNSDLNSEVTQMKLKYEKLERDSSAKCEGLQKELGDMNKEKRKLLALAAMKPAGCITHTFADVRKLISFQHYQSSVTNINGVFWYFIIQHVLGDYFNVSVYRDDKLKTSDYFCTVHVNLLPMRMGIKPVTAQFQHRFERGCDYKTGCIYLSNDYITEDDKATVQVVIYKN